MNAQVICTNPKCGMSLSVPEQLLGKTAKCRFCDHYFVLRPSAGDTDPQIQANRPTNLDLPIAPSGLPIAPSGLPIAPSGSHSGSKPQINLDAESIGQIGRFRIVQKLGAGAFGAVYKAHDPLLDRMVAIKIPHSSTLENPKRVERFLREAKAAAQLHHPNIVPVFETGKEDGRSFIVAAFIDGKPLEDAIEEGGMELRRAAQIARELAEALAYAHQQGVVHRDVKPANILMDSKGRVQLADFGLAARQEEARMTNDGALLGTPSYMAPEAALGQKGEAKPASDQYSAGVVLYELLTGRTPFEGTPEMVIYNAINTEPDSPKKHRPGLVRDLETICLKAMAKRAEDRYADCGALADDLRRWLDGQPILARRMSYPERFVRWVRKEVKLAASVFVVLLGLTIATLMSLVSAERQSKALENEREARRIAKDREEAALRSEEKAIANAEQARKSAADAERHFREAKDQEQKTAVEAAIARKNLSRAEFAETQATEEATLARKAERLAEMRAKDLEQEKATVLRRTSELEAERLATIRRTTIAQLAHAETLMQLNRGDKAEQLLGQILPEERTWEWGHLLLASRAKDRPSTRFDLGGSLLVRPMGNLRNPRSVQPSPDGSRVAVIETTRVTGKDTWITIVNSLTGVTERKLNAPNCRCVGWSSEGAELVSISISIKVPRNDCDIDVVRWDTQTGVATKKTTFALALPPCGIKIDADAGKILCICPDDAPAQLVISTLDERKGVIVNNNVVRIPSNNKPSICEFIGEFMACEVDNQVLVYNCTKKSIAHTVTVNPIVGQSRLCMTNDGTRIWIADKKGIHCWNTITGKLSHTIPSEKGKTYTDISISPDQKRIATCCADSSIELWDIETGLQTFTIPLERGDCSRISYSDDGTILVVGMSTQIRSWPSRTGKMVRNLSAELRLNSIFWMSLDGRFVAGVSPDSLAFVLRDIAGKKQRVALPSAAMNLSRDGRYVFCWSNGTIRVNDMQSATVTEHDEKSNGIAYASFSSDGKYFAYSVGNRFIRTIDLASKKLDVHELELPTTTPKSIGRGTSGLLIFGPPARPCICEFGGRNLCYAPLANSKKGAIARTFDGPISAVEGSSDGQSFAVLVDGPQSNDKLAKQLAVSTIYLLDVVTGKELRKFTISDYGAKKLVFVLGGEISVPGR